MSSTEIPVRPSRRLTLPVTVYFCLIGFMADCFNAGIAILGQVFLADERFHANERQLGLLGAATSLGYGLPAIMTGLLSERLGRRALVTFSMCGLTTVYLITPHVRTLEQLYLVSFLRAFSASCLWAPVMAWISDVTPSSVLSKVLGRYNISWAAGICAGFYLAGWLFEKYGALVTFNSAAILAVLTLALVITTEPRASAAWGETEAVGDGPPQPDETPATLLPRDVALSWVRRALLLMGVGCALQEMILYLTPRLVGETAKQEAQGVLLATRMGGQVLAFAWFASHGDAWHFRRWPLAAGLASFAAGALVLGSGGTQFSLWLVGYALIGFGVGAGYMQSAYYTLSLLRNKGLGGGIMETLVGGGAFLGPLFGGYLSYYVGQMWPAANGPRVAVLSALVPIIILAAFMLRRGPLKEQPSGKAPFEPSPSRTSWKGSRNLRRVLLAGAVFWVALTFSSSLRKSAAVDEVPHIGAGLAIWHYRDFRMNPEHPPFIKALATLPVYLIHCPDLRVAFGKNVLSAWADSQQNEYGYHLLFRGGKDPLAVLAFARVIPVLIGLLGGWFAYRWGREISRRAAGGALAAFALLTYPEYIGHSRFVTLDVPTLVACGAVSWFAFRWWRRPAVTSSGALLAAFAIGSQVKLPVTVFTAFTLATFALMSIGRLFAGSTEVRRGRANTSPVRRLLLVLALAVAMGVTYFAASWASAGFRYRHHPASQVPEKLGSYIPNPEAPAAGLRATLIQLCARHHLLPEATLATINHVGSFEGRPMYLLGEHGRTGWYHYFLVSFLAKTPITMIVAFVIALFITLRRSRSAAAWWRLERASILALPFACLFTLYCASRPNIGHRQVLFIYFPIAVLLGAAGSRVLYRGGLNARRAVTGFTALLGAIALLAFPHYETYFNEAIRTPYRGHRILRDSNVDWGTDLPLAGRVFRELRAGGYSSVNYAAFGLNQPSSYGVLEFNWLLPSYPFALYMPPAVRPIPTLPSIISLHCLEDLRNLYPELYAREPDLIMNSMTLFLPRK